MMKTCRILTTLALVLTFQATNAQTHLGFNSDIENYVQLLKLPTLAVAVAKGDSLIFFKGVGSVSDNREDTITKDNIFTIASVTKTFTSVILQQLEAEDKISLTDLIDNYPNRYFNANRWDKNTILAQIISHTSESQPLGKNFAYNGSKFNLVFNVFTKLNPPLDTESITRPFTKEVEQRILSPLNMTHTLVRYNEAEHSHLKKFIVTAYDFSDSEGMYLADPIVLPNIETGPAYGMMSSVTDLIKYSTGLDNHILLSQERFEKITSPFYPNSVQGLGWFTCNFEGIDMDWAYGYGFNDSAVFLKVPSRNLTLILLSSCTMPSATSRLEYGNPLNSPIVSSFIKNFILNLNYSIQFENSAENILEQILTNTTESKSTIYIEQAFAMINTTLLSPTTTLVDKEKSTWLLKLLIKNYPNNELWQSTTGVELLSSVNEKSILRFASKITKIFYRTAQLHPAKLFFAGVIQEKLGKSKNAMHLFKLLADGETFREQIYKLDALMKLAKYFQKTSPELSKSYLERLIKYKEYVGAEDGQYTEAKEMYSKL